MPRPYHRARNTNFANHECQKQEEFDAILVFDRFCYIRMPREVENFIALVVLLLAS